jgi:SAM-dependent methyltransferase
VAQDSSLADFWDSRFRGGVTPWDAAGVPPLLDAWTRKKPPCTVLVPGCGTGYEVRLFAERGHDVLGIDFADAALEAAAVFLGPLARRTRKADFFSFETAPFDLVYERAFLCALPRRMWPQWAARVAQLVRPGGELAGFFYIGDNEKGPPFGIAPHALDEFLTANFHKEHDAAVPARESIPVFQGKERWQVWKRKL